VATNVPGVLELRAIWLLAGVICAALHWPFGRAVLLAIAVPWVAVMLLLSRQEPARRMLDSWREALGSRPGAYGAAGLSLVVIAVGLIVHPAAGALLGLWLIAAATLIGVFRGPNSLGEQLMGWSLLATAVAVPLFAAEGVLRLESVGTRVGTPQERNAWWARYDSATFSNILGIRSPYETLRKEPGVLRVVAIGDSFTWGSKIASSDSTWPAQLEAELRRRIPDTPVEVVNLGQAGFTMVNNARMLRRLGWQFDPDIVVVQFFLNDILPSGRDFTGGETSWLFPRPSLLPDRYRGGPLGASALKDVVESVLTVRRHGDGVAQAATWAEVYQRQGPEWHALADAVKEMGSAAAERDVPIVLMLFPDLLPGSDDPADVPFRMIHEHVVDVGRRAGFSILDLTSSFFRDEGEDLRRWWATPYDAHPNAAAAGVAARRVADRVMRILDPGAPGAG
jgi:lysophospholipase L1-like esterase